MAGAMQSLGSPGPRLAALLNAGMELLQLRTSSPPSSSSPQPDSCLIPSWGGFCRVGMAGDVSPCCCLGCSGMDSQRIPCMPELAGKGAWPTGPAGFTGRARKSLHAGGPLPAALPVPGSLPHSPWPQKRKSWFFLPEETVVGSTAVCREAHAALPPCSPFIPPPCR